MGACREISKFIFLDKALLMLCCSLVEPTLWSKELPKLETFEIFTSNSHQLWKLAFLIVAFLVSRNIILLPRCGLRFWTERSVWDPQAVSDILHNFIF